MNKNRIRLTESQLHGVIKESVKKILREGTFDPYDEKYKDFQNDFSWKQFDMDNNDPTIDFEKTAHSRTPLQGNGNLNLYGNARDENWNVQDTHGLNAMNAMSNNPYARHQAQHMGSTLKQSADNGMNDMSKLGESKLHEISYGGTSKQGKPYDNWDGGFGDNWSDEQWAEYKKKREEKYKDMPNRDYFNESKGFANKEQSKMMDWKKTRTDAFYDKDGKPISKKYTPRDKDGIPKPIKVRESQLHNIVKESINKVIQEGWFGNLFNRGNNEQPSKEQGIKSTDLPQGVYPSLKGATMGISSQKYVIVYELRTNWKTLYVHPYTVERSGINAVINKLRKLGIKVLSSNQERFENPNWNGLNYDRKVEPKYGYGDGERDDFTTLSWPSRM